MKKLENKKIKGIQAIVMVAVSVLIAILSFFPTITFRSDLRSQKMKVEVDKIADMVLEAYEIELFELQTTAENEKEFNNGIDKLHKKYQEGIIHKLFYVQNGEDGRQHVFISSQFIVDEYKASYSPIKIALNISDTIKLGKYLNGDIEELPIEAISEESVGMLIFETTLIGSAEEGGDFSAMEAGGDFSAIVGFGYSAYFIMALWFVFPLIMFIRGLIVLIKYLTNIKTPENVYGYSLNCIYRALRWMPIFFLLPLLSNMIAVNTVSVIMLVALSLTVVANGVLARFKEYTKTEKRYLNFTQILSMAGIVAFALYVMGLSMTDFTNSLYLGRLFMFGEGIGEVPITAIIGSCFVLFALFGFNYGVKTLSRGGSSLGINGKKDSYIVSASFAFAGFISPIVSMVSSVVTLPATKLATFALYGFSTLLILATEIVFVVLKKKFVSDITSESVFAVNRGETVMDTIEEIKAEVKKVEEEMEGKNIEGKSELQE